MGRLDSWLGCYQLKGSWFQSPMSTVSFWLSLSNNPYLPLNNMSKPNCFVLNYLLNSMVSFIINITFTLMIETHFLIKVFQTDFHTASQCLIICQPFSLSRLNRMRISPSLKTEVSTAWRSVRSRRRRAGRIALRPTAARLKRSSVLKVNKRTF